MTITGPVVALDEGATHVDIGIATDHPLGEWASLITDRDTEEYEDLDWTAESICSAEEDGCDAIQVGDEVSVRAVMDYREWPGRDYLSDALSVTEVTTN